MTVTEPRLLILETSGRVGQVALAEGEQLRGVRLLDEARRHARDLVPTVKALLDANAWQPRDLHGVIVSRGPGSYTGLRVGIMSAKALAYATGCALLAVDTFAAIAEQTPAEALTVDVLADAQQDRVYVQTFGRLASAGPLAAQSALQIQPFSAWISVRRPDVWVSGPGLRGKEGRLPEGTQLVETSLWDPRPESMLRLGLARYRSGQRDDLWSLEPLYLRPSSAEEQWQGK